MSCHGHQHGEGGEDHRHHRPDRPQRGPDAGKIAMWVAGLAALAAVVWFAYQRSGGTNLLVYGFLLLCPLMHLLMHGAHHRGGHRHGSSTQARQEEYDR